MDDKTSSIGKYDELIDDLEERGRLMHRLDKYGAAKLIGSVQAVMAALGIRVTNVSAGSEGIAMTYEYKWVPTDGSKAIPRWDTGVVTTDITNELGIYDAYIRILRIATTARDYLRDMPKQVMDL